LKQP